MVTSTESTLGGRSRGEANGAGRGSPHHVQSKAEIGQRESLEQAIGELAGPAAPLLGRLPITTSVPCHWSLSWPDARGTEDAGHVLS